MVLTLGFRVLHSPGRRLFDLVSRAAFTRAMSSVPWIPNQYPSARRSDHVDTYKSENRGEVRVPDPYQWLEEHSEETEQWTTAQEAFTRTYLDKNPHRLRLEREIRSNTDFAKVLRKREKIIYIRSE